MENRYFSQNTSEYSRRHHWLVEHASGAKGTVVPFRLRRAQPRSFNRIEWVECNHRWFMSWRFE